MRLPRVTGLSPVYATAIRRALFVVVALVVLAAVLVIAALVNFTRRDVAYTAVILWALAGIAVKFAGVAAVAIPTWITFGLVALTLAAAWLYRRPAAGPGRVA